MVIGRAARGGRGRWLACGVLLGAPAWAFGDNNTADDNYYPVPCAAQVKPWVCVGRNWVTSLRTDYLPEVNARVPGASAMAPDRSAAAVFFCVPQGRLSLQAVQARSRAIYARQTPGFRQTGQRLLTVDGAPALETFGVAPDHGRLLWFGHVLTVKNGSACEVSVAAGKPAAGLSLLHSTEAHLFWARSEQDLVLRTLRAGRARS